ncbi:hypothetical protein Q4Q35_00870 [Flavivirga aquimarina]|uniref:HTH luxR-type domain-containing protein n=1 Tax=Flavivirga aquimarina TaxID=2027862 RepID=A0ABT8W5H9_9FLAO|nr:hypothetical protein [Flavivirga aquimarina]MDO5968347.1 hypothetical protein [Flavivirga aquimarina]
MILIATKRLVMQLSVVIILLYNFTLYSQQLHISSLNKEQLNSIIDSTGFRGKSSTLLLQLFNRSKTLKSFSAQYDVSYKLGLYYFIKAKKDSSLYYFNTAEYIYKTNRHRLEYKIIEDVYRDKAILLVDLGLINMGIKYFNKAYELFLTSGNYKKAISCKMNLAACYMELKDFDKSIVLMKEVLVDSFTKDPMIKIGSYNALSLSYNARKNHDEAIRWANKGIAIGKELDNPAVLSTLYSNLGLYYSGRKEYKKALKYGFKGKKISDSMGNYRRTNLRYGNIGSYYLGLKNYEKAEEYLTKGINGNSNFESLKEIYTNFIELYHQQNKIKKEVNSYKAYVSLLDSVVLEKDKYYIQTVDKQRELIEQEYKNKELVAENKWIVEKNTKQKIAIIGLFIILIISLLCIYLLYKHKKNKQTISELKSSEKKLLEEQIRLRDNELDASAMAISQKIELLNTIKTTLEAVKDNNPELTRVNKTVKNLIASSSDISVVTDRIESQYPTLTIELKIKHPELSDTEIKYCLLTKLNLSLKETASMLNVTPNTVKVTRSRLKKKMNIPTNLSFKSYLDQIHNLTLDATHSESVR